MHDFRSLKLNPKVGHFWQCCLTTAFAKWLAIFPLFKMVSFFNWLGAFWAVSTIEYLCYYCRDVFACFWHLKVKTQKRPFLAVLACYSLSKMVNFASFKIVSFSLVCLRTLFVLFLVFEIYPQGRSFLTILPYYSLNLMVIFTTFQNDVIFFKY